MCRQTHGQAEREEHVFLCPEAANGEEDITGKEK